ncbi:MAG: helix-turn-helix domain-containing protein [Oscillospiraceae bacterium]|nr:helix-turn-helix domain-containing protein [Oscillospiraceae bacterium]
MPSKNENNQSEIVMYSVEDIQRIFKLSKTNTYNLINSKGFPKIRLNRRIVIPKKQLEKWIEIQSGHDYNY